MPNYEFSAKVIDHYFPLGIIATPRIIVRIDENKLFGMKLNNIPSWLFFILAVSILSEQFSISRYKNRFIDFGVNIRKDT